MACPCLAAGPPLFHLYIVILGRGIVLAELGSFPIGMQARYVVLGMAMELEWAHM